MIDILPDEILQVIINKTQEKRDPIQLLELRDINKTFRTLVDSMKDYYSVEEPWNKDVYSSQSENILLFCKKNISKERFTWLFANNVNIFLPHINQLIKSDRPDIIKLGFRNLQFLKILFNRFYINNQIHIGDTDCPQFPHIIFTGTENPLMTAARTNRITILRLLLDESTAGNCYRTMIPSLLDISIKYNYKDLLDYVITTHYTRIETIIQSKIMSMIHRITDCEDTLFHLFYTKDIEINERILRGLIIMNYKTLYKYCYEIFRKHEKRVMMYHPKLLHTCFECNNIELTEYLISELQSGVYSEENISHIINIAFEKYNKYTDEYLYMLINNYGRYFSETSKLLKISIVNNISETSIEKIITHGFIPDLEDIAQSLIHKNIPLLKVLINNIENT